MAKFDNIIKYTGLDNLNLLEKARLKNIAESSGYKIQRLFQNPVDIAINIKIYDKEKRKKYSINGRVEAASKIFAANATDWDIKRTTHMLMNKLENEVKKQFKPETKNWRYGFKKFLNETFKI